MDLITGQEGKLVKMKISACEDTAPYAATGEEYEVLINPEKIVRKFETVYDDTQAEGTTGTDLRFRRQKPQVFNLELLFDGTGVVANDKLPLTGILPPMPEKVSDQVGRFKQIVLEYDGTRHSPNLVQIQWGDFLFKGKLKDVTFTYTLFNPDGTPLRAKAECKFVESIDDELRVARERSESPDLTHIRAVKEDDSLPLMANRIYQDPAYYMEVAKVNKLKSVRNLRTGDRIHFPPVRKESR